ncbi:MAG: MoxR family ATPase [Pseudomonadota bacterium]
MNDTHPSSNIHQSRESIDRLRDNLNLVIHSNREQLDWLLAAFIAGGHVLLEDVPGTGKTTLAKTLATSIDSRFKRIQFTPDLLPSDILGVSIFNQQTQAFSFQQGPIFTQILLADEINRASPRTQSALLEAMAENQVSVEGETMNMDDLFFVLATQNPVEFHGTYPLPEAQMDRFTMRFELGYVNREQEISILMDQQDAHPLTRVTPVVSQAEVLQMRHDSTRVHVAESLVGYIVDLVASTRGHAAVQIGASPRAGIALMNCARALTLVQGGDFVTPDVIQSLAGPVIAHRLKLDTDATFGGTTDKQVIVDILGDVDIPE